MYDPGPVDSMAAEVTVVGAVAHGGRQIDLLGRRAIIQMPKDVFDEGVQRFSARQSESEATQSGGLRGTAPTDSTNHTWR